MRYYDRKINYYETDQMAIVHHSNYIRYFEEARISFMEQLGYPYDRLESEEILSPVINVSCKYLRPIRFGDSVRIYVKLTSVTKVKCAFAYEIRDLETDELRARGSSENGFVTREGRPVVLTKEKPEFYKVFKDEFDSDPDPEGKQR